MGVENHNRHHGAAVIITDPLRSWFYLQRKCGKYPIIEYRGGHCFFGGEIEKGEDEREALIREIHEELDAIAASYVTSRLQEFRRLDVIARGNTYTITIFESVIQQPALDEIADPRKHKIKEGMGALVHRDEALAIPYIWGLEAVMKSYLENNTQTLKTKRQLEF